MVDIEKYKLYRQTLVKLHSRIMNDHIHEMDFKQAANLLGILKRDVVDIESNREKDALYDFNIYGNIRNGKVSYRVMLIHARRTTKLKMNC
jgi:hypothetical protein